MSKLINLIGKRFGKWLVLNRLPSVKSSTMWLCRCDCGTKKAVKSNHLIDGSSKSCGCSIVDDKTGRRYGSYTVLRHVPEKKGNGRYYLCRCDCGTEKVLNGGALVTGNSISCGCLRRKDLNHLTLSGLYSAYKRSAKSRGHEFTISKEDFGKLIFCNCHYCGSIPSNPYKHKKFYNSDKDRISLYSGIDRVDNSKGYTTENCVPCCKICNFGKHTLSKKEWFDHMRKIMEYNL